MNKITIEIDHDQLDELIRKSLMSTYETLSYDHKKDNPMVFLSDPEEDKKEIMKRLDALDLIIDYYSSSEQYKEWSLYERGL